MTDKDIFEEQENLNLFPGRAPLELLSQLPKTIIFTSEFDMYRRDAYKLADSLTAAGTLSDFQDMNMVHYGYQQNGQMNQCNEYYKELKAAFEAYVLEKQKVDGRRRTTLIKKDTVLVKNDKNDEKDKKKA